MQKLFIANRGEIAVRIARAAAARDILSVGIHSADDGDALHIRRTDEAVALPGTGPAAYLDVEAVVGAAREAGCDAVHPGYGFLSESADLARHCEEAGLAFVGPTVATLASLGDKARARAIALAAGIPVLPGSDGPVDVEQALAFFDRHGPMMIKAVAGGGGRGMRPINDREAVADTHRRCSSEALAGFGSDAVYCEKLVGRARHVEVQIVGDGTGDVVHLWDRECSLQRQRQKIVEMAPAPGLDMALRHRLFDAAIAIGRAVKYRGVGTVEFLVDLDTGSFYFIEANARLQVEHTVTEAVTGLDLVNIQLMLADGASLRDLDLLQDRIPAPRGIAIQARVNAETIGADGMPRPSGGRIRRYEVPAGPGVRVDDCGSQGYQPNPRFDSLLAKVIATAPTGGLASATRLTDRALGEFSIDGIDTNLAFLRALLQHPEVAGGTFDTLFIERNLGLLLERADELRPDPSLSAADEAQSPDRVMEAPAGTVAIAAPMTGSLIALLTEANEAVAAGQPIAIMEAMKLEHVITAPTAGYVRLSPHAVGAVISEGNPILFFEEADVGLSAIEVSADFDPDHIRADLAELQARRALTLDAARPDAVAKRRARGYRTARENVADIVDEGSFIEYGSLVIAGQRLRHPVDHLVRTTPADGMVTGIGRVNGDIFGADASRCVVMSYDYTVQAGTQGLKNHEKTDRMLELAERWQLPVILFAESGGGRPGDTDRPAGGGIFNTRAFALQGRLSALVPQIAIANGRCFAGAAVLLGCCDVVIATKDTTMGVGGPALIEGGGLGIYTPEEVGPADVQAAGGVIDILAEDEADAVRIAQKYLSYFQGRLPTWEVADQRLLRGMVPENRLRAYDVRQIIETLSDIGSVLELREKFGRAAITALARIEGRPVGIIANNSAYLGGAVDADAADKCSRFMQLCDAFDIPIVVLADTPGNMVGPEAEKTGLIRHCCRMFVTGPNLTVPLFSVVLRKGYGLGVMAMVGGHSQAPFFTLSWPTGEFGGMGLEGAVKLGYRKEMEAIADLDERQRWYEQRVAASYENGKAISTAMGFDFDEVIDPAETRAHIVAGLESIPAPVRTGKKKRPFIDSW
ncbi:carboxyl transferase domain-containing protein [Sphingopyxis sp. DBS4]|jgi:acetyl/propionyl-CoA carboxylase alpha subunit|uniref:acetyl-CoA carboxylase family protein n=1 Tax=Sphingopyxis sp. DBS4 TaxID=2968500 RepID=UPI00214BD4BE|nr:carboxyl transferase domain-containing protein [Sphingopyxis sp. DBS4]